MKLPIPEKQRRGMRGKLFLIVFAILFAAFIFNFEHVWGFISKLFSLSSPFFIGFGITFLLLPVQRRLEKLLGKALNRRRKHPKLVRGLAAVFAVLLMLLLVALVLRILVPQLITSAESLIAFISGFLQNNGEKMSELLNKYGFLKSITEDGKPVIEWVSLVSSQIERLPSVLNNVVSIGSSIAGVLYKLLVGLITSIYILIDRDRLAAQIKKIGYSVFRRKSFEELIYWTRRGNRLFAGFITGKIVDSIIIGILCYLGMLLFGMDYAVLFSVIVGITNFIPFFGPFIGWAPCALIMLIVDPMETIWFSLWILALQQLDGNLIGPLILGDYVGVSALSIMIAIVLGSGLFGFTGMLLSVPVYALGYAFFRTAIEERLKKRKLPTQTEEYIYAPDNLPPQEDASEDGEDEEREPEEDTEDI